MNLSIESTFKNRITLYKIGHKLLSHLEPKLDCILNKGNEIRFSVVFFKKWASFSFTFGLFKQTIQFLKQINAKNVHPVNGAGIQTHDLLNMSHYP